MENNQHFIQLINKLRDKTKLLEEIAFEIDERNQVLVDRLSQTKDKLEDNSNRLKVERQLREDILKNISQKVNEELVSNLPDRLMKVAEDIESIDIKCAQALGEDVDPIRLKTQEFREKSPEEQAEIEAKIEEMLREKDAESSYYIPPDMKHEEPKVYRENDQGVFEYVEENKDEDERDDNSSSNLNNIFINGEKPEVFFNKITESKIQSLKQILQIQPGSTLDINLEDKSPKEQLKELVQLYQIFRLKYIIYLQYIKPAYKLSYETNYLRNKKISKHYNNIENTEKLPSFEDFIQEFHNDENEIKTKKPQENNHENNQEMLDNLFGDLDDMNMDIGVQILRAMLLSSMLKTSETEEDYYKEHIHGLESLIKYVDKYENYSNKSIPSIKSNLSIKNILEKEKPDYLLFENIDDNQILQDTLKYYFEDTSKSEERIKELFKEMEHSS